MGGSILGAGTNEFRSRTDIDFPDTDISFGFMTRLICHAHALPIPDAGFDPSSRKPFSNALPIPLTGVSWS